jgi:hypothetical protein
MEENISKEDNITAAITTISTIKEETSSPTLPKEEDDIPKICSTLSLPICNNREEIPKVVDDIPSSKEIPSSTISSSSSLISSSSSDIIIFTDEKLINYYSSNYLRLNDKDLFKETLNNVIFAVYERDMTKGILIKTNDDSDNINTRKSKRLTDKRKFFDTSLIEYDTNETTITMLAHKNAFENKVKNGLVYSKATKYIQFELFCDFPSATWFSDQVVTAYCLLLNQRESALRKKLTNRKKILFLDSTFFYYCISKINIYLTEERDIEIQNKRLQHIFEHFGFINYDKIFLFANQKNNHWVLFEVNISDSIINMYDSFYSGITPTAKIQFLQIQHFIKVNLKNSTTIWQTKAVECKYQTNGDDCGVYMLTFSFVLSDFTFEIVKKLDCVALSRLKIAMDITRGYIEDPRLDGYKYQKDDSGYAGLDAITPFEYDQFMIDLSMDTDDKDIDCFNNNIDKIDKLEKSALIFFVVQRNAQVSTLLIKMEQDKKSILEKEKKRKQDIEKKHLEEKQKHLEEKQKHLEEKLAWDEERKNLMELNKKLNEIILADKK